MGLTRVTSLAGAAAINVLVSRVLGPAGRGSYALPIIDCGLAATLIMGFSSALPYFMLKSGVDRGLLRPIVRAMVVFILAGSALTVAIGLSNRQLWALLPALAYLPFYALLTTVSGYCIGRDKIRYGGLLNVAVPFLTLASIGAGFLLFGRTAHVAVFGWLFGTAVTAICAVVIALRYVRPDRDSAVRTPDFIRFAAKAGTLNMVNVLNYRIDVYIVAMIAPLSTLGLYSVAVAGAEAAVALAHSFSLAMQPRVGSLDRSGAAIFTARCSRSNLLFAALLCTVVALIATPRGQKCVRRRFPSGRPGSAGASYRRRGFVGRYGVTELLYAQHRPYARSTFGRSVLSGALRDRQPHTRASNRYDGRRHRNRHVVRSEPNHQYLLVLPRERHKAGECVIHRRHRR